MSQTKLFNKKILHTMWVKNLINMLVSKKIIIIRALYDQLLVTNDLLTFQHFTIKLFFFLLFSFKGSVFYPFCFPQCEFFTQKSDLKYFEIFMVTTCFNNWLHTNLIPTNLIFFLNKYLFLPFFPKHLILNEKNEKWQFEMLKSFILKCH